MQIHNYGAWQTIMSIVHFNIGGAVGIGIGNDPSATPDYTFTYNGANYTVKNLQVLVGNVGGGAVTDILPSTSAVTISPGAVLDLNESHRYDRCPLAGAGDVLFGTGRLSVGSDHTHTTFSGSLTGDTAATLTKPARAPSHSVDRAPSTAGPRWHSARWW